MKWVKRYKKILMGILVFVSAFCYMFFLNEFCLDEVWNYGFGYNLAKGLVPYRDFNMVILPLFPLILSIFLKLCNYYIWGMYLFQSFLFLLFFLFLYPRIKKKFWILYPCLLLVSYPSYNFFAFFLLVIILLVNDSDYLHKDFWLGILVSLVFLTKHSIGIFLVIPLFLYSKNKLKSLCSFGIPVLICLFYLVATDSLGECINYCFLGMFDFASKNIDLIFLPFALIIIFILFHFYKDSGFRDQKCLYVLMFQIVVFPMFDWYHFMIGFNAFLVYLLMTADIADYQLKYYMMISWSVLFIWFFSLNGVTNILNVYDKNGYLVTDSSTYLYGKMVNRKVMEQLEEISGYLEENTSLYDHVYIVSSNSYFIKLYNGMEIDKYDLINNGNMGYYGSVLYRKEIGDYCDKKRCLFLRFPDEYERTSQTNREIWEWVDRHYSWKERVGIFDIYISDV